MAEIKPFRAWRYNDELVKNIGELTSPLFDVASEKQKATLYSNPRNSIHLSIPGGEYPLENASNILRQWKAEGCLQRDTDAAIYVYYQYFKLPGDPSRYCRKGFICKIRVYDWDQNVILRHENTMPGSVHEQVALLAATRLNASPTHGLYSDETFELEKFMDDSMPCPICETEAEDLKILPTHRLIRQLDNFDETSILNKFEKYFTVKPVPDPDIMPEIIAGKSWTFGLIFTENAYQVRLKPDVHATMKWNFPDDIKVLDLTVMHYFIIQQILGIKGNDQSTSSCIEYERSFAACLAKVLKKEVRLALITNEISISEVKTVCRSGYTLPQKSTYFWPKAICGFVFSSI